MTTPTEVGGTINYTFDNFDFSDGVYTYHDGIESEFVPGAIRSLVAARDLSGTIRVVDNDTIEWSNTGGGVRTFTIVLKANNQPSPNPVPEPQPEPNPEPVPEPQPEPNPEPAPEPIPQINFGLSLFSVGNML